MNEPSPDFDHYAKAWRRLRFYEITFWTLFLAFLPAWLLVHFTLRAFMGARGDDVTFDIFIVWGLVWMASLVRREAFTCPRCGETFHGRPHTIVPASSCANCGLRQDEIPLSGDWETPEL